MRDYKEMSSQDIKLALLSGDMLMTDNIVLPQYTLREIKDFGYSQYMGNLQWLSLTVDDFIDSVSDLEKRIFLQAEKSKLVPFDFFTKLADEMTREMLLELIAMILKTDDVRYMEEDNYIAINFLNKNILIENENGELEFNSQVVAELSNEDLMVINRDNFGIIAEMTKVMNYLKSPPKKEKDFNPANEEAMRLKEQMDANRKKIEEIKRRENDDDEDSPDFTSIVSAVTVKSNSINKFNVWDLTLYQLYDEYARLELIDNYNFSINAMMAGAKDISYKHWSSVI